MCGIFGFLIRGRALASQNCYSWRHLWNQLYNIRSRGPDATELVKVSNNLILGFQRLRIMDTSTAGDQPLRKGNVSVICNGEIYNFEKLKQQYGFQFESNSDCEIFLHLYEKFGSVEKFIDKLDGVFAFILHDGNTGETFVGRDPIGVRPVFIGQDVNGNYGFASEAKALRGLCEDNTIKPFPPGHLWNSNSTTFEKWYNPTFNFEDVNLETYNEANDLQRTAQLLQQSVRKRMMSDRPIGTFLSGGLDSSLVAALIKKYHHENNHVDTRLNTFSVGLEGSPDLAYSEIVAKHIQSSHHHVEIHPDDCLNALEDVIYATETFDVTTIRASTPMYLLSKYIRENTDDIVIYSGEGSDEVTQGYLYFKKQPSTREGAMESKRLMEQLYEFDVLRVDRTTAAHGLEVREPFLDKAFMQHYFNLPANIKCPRNNHEKYHLRKAIETTFPGLLPPEVLWRQKEAFSDGVSSFKKKSWVDELKDYANSIISDEQFEEERRMYDPMPMFKDALYLRRIFNKHYGAIYPPLISKYWVPQWSGENPDSSARKLDLFDAAGEARKMSQDLEEKDYLKSKLERGGPVFDTKAVV